MNADHITMVLWMPTEYWEREFALEPQITSERKAEALKVVNQYNLLAVIDAKRGGLERLDYTPSDMVVKNTKITAPNGQTYSPLSDDQIGMGVKNLFSALQPVMTNMLGDFGKHTIFVVFPGVDRSGKRLVQ